MFSTFSAERFVPAVQAPLTGAEPAWWFAFSAGQLLWPEAADAEFARQHEPTFARESAARHYLGTLGDVACWALAVDAVPNGWRGLPLRASLLSLPAPLASLAGRAAQVLEWDRTHRHCGVCGTPTQRQATERARRCPACGQVAYPRLSPAMMVLVWRGRELLLARSPQYSAGMYSALAGFVEPGESLEECVVREVAEEVSVSIRNLRYYGSQSWPFPHSLMVAYTAEWAGGEIVPQADEIEAADWFGIDALPIIPPRYSIAGHLIRDTVAAMSASST